MGGHTALPSKELLVKLNELKKRMRGVVVVQTTPFKADGNVDEEGLLANARWLANFAQGKDFIITPLGSTGEFYALSEEERGAVLKAVLEEAKGKVIVFAGACAAATLQAVRLSRQAQSAGADGVMVVLPFYHVPSEEGMFLHYKTIAESVGPDMGIMIYNNPLVSGSWINPPLMKRLSKIPNIIAIKENIVDIELYHAMRNSIDPADTVLFTGSCELVAVYLAAFGCPGFISVIANFAPEISYSVYQSLAHGELEKAAEICKTRVEPFNAFIGRLQEKHGPHTGFHQTWGGVEGFMYIGAVKAAMDLVGLRGGKPRLPLLGLSREERAELKDVLKAMKVL
jgi:4-hydroxy-tetrahydrodipicolinate synthase